MLLYVGWPTRVSPRERSIQSCGRLIERRRENSSTEKSLMRRFLAYIYIAIIVCVFIVVVDVVVVVVGVVVFVALMVVVVVVAVVVVVGLLCVASRLISNSPRFTSCLWVTKLKILDQPVSCTLYFWSLSLSFRRLFSIMSYFFFFYNIILGLFSAFMRTLQGVLLGVIFISRIDRTSLMQGFQAWDKGT